jgi:hypothetical protein
MPNNETPDNADGTELLCRAVYGRKAKTQDYLGGSEARMLHDAANMIKRARDFMGDLYEDGCEYGDNCPRFVALKHYECRACRVRYFLEESSKEMDSR